MTIVFNDDRFPLVKVSVTGFVTDDDLAQLLVDINGLFDRKKKFTLLCNVNHMTGNPAQYALLQVYTLAKWMRVHDTETKLYMEKTILFTSGSLIKIILKAVFFIKKPNSEFVFCKNVDEVKASLKKSSLLRDR